MGGPEERGFWARGPQSKDILDGRLGGSMRNPESFGVAGVEESRGGKSRRTLDSRGGGGGVFSLWQGHNSGGQVTASCSPWHCLLSHLATSPHAPHRQIHAQHTYNTHTPHAQIRTHHR